jgi:hypothetical protein
MDSILYKNCSQCCCLLCHYDNWRHRLPLRHFGDTWHCRLQCFHGVTQHSCPRATTAIRGIVFGRTAMTISCIVFSLTATGIHGVIFCRDTSMIGVVIFRCDILAIHNNQPKEGHTAKMPATEVKQLATASQRQERRRGWHNTNAIATTATQQLWQW